MGSPVPRGGYHCKVFQETVRWLVLSSHSVSSIRVPSGHTRVGPWPVDQEFSQRTEHEHAWDSWYNNICIRHASGILQSSWFLPCWIDSEIRYKLRTLTFIQLLAFCLQTDEEQGWRKYWVIYHNVVGYALIVLIIANIFQGINNHSGAKRWEWVYGTVLGVLGITALVLQVLRWIPI